MPTFEPFKDSPAGNIHTEGQQISLSLVKTGPTTARVSWDIPTPSAGCDSTTQAYNGIVIMLDTTPENITKVPVDGTKYSADPTADYDLHAGDRIGTALVVGAFYDDKTTLFLDITGLDPDTPYYVSGHAVDNVLRYHLEGVHAYVLGYGNQDRADTNGYQILDAGVAGTDLTGLLTGTNYTFKFDLDDRFFDHPANEQLTVQLSGTTPSLDHTDDPVITIDGTLAQTYDELIAEINKQFALLDSPPQSTGAPNLGSYFYDNGTLYQWDGMVHNSLDVIVQNDDPTVITLGAFWYDSDDDILYKYSGTWDPQTVIQYSTDPTQPECTDFWFDGLNGYQWNGTVWELKTLYNQEIDPSLPPVLTCPYYWYDENSLYLYEWNDETAAWDQVDPVMNATDPTIVALNDYWYDTVNGLVKQWDGLVWNTLTVSNTTTEPTMPMNGDLWFNPNTEELKQYNSTTLVWDTLSILVSPFEPNNPPSAALWWDTTLNVIKVWDVTTSLWDVAANFVESAIDPSAAEVMVTGDLWYKPSTDTLYQWDGTNWVAVEFMFYATDPTLPNIGDYWQNGTLFYEWTGAWTPITYTSTKTDPYTPTAGDFWFDADGSTLYQWSGTAWVSMLYSTTPYTPTKGDIYFDLGTNQLMKWDGTSWVQTIPKAIVSLLDGDLKFASTSTGSKSGIAIVEDEGDLFPTLTAGITYNPPIVGTDGLSGTPSYAEIGVGNDGSPDERRELIDSIRAQLGYPVIDVELTKYQWDQCINGAIEEFRRRSATAYRRAYFFMDIEPGKQIYTLTDERVGFHKIVNIMDIYRTQSSFLGTAEGQGVYGQLLLQHLYQLGTFDLISYHLVNEYVETMGQMFAAGIQYHWYEDTRQLLLEQAFWRPERILLDAEIERTEQELIKDRWSKTWIENFAMASAMLLLAQIRGKYASLPGAGGGVALNAADLNQQAEIMFEELYQEMDDFLVSNKEWVGMGSDFIIG